MEQIIKTEHAARLFKLHRLGIKIRENIVFIHDTFKNLLESLESTTLMDCNRQKSLVWFDKENNPQFCFLKNELCFCGVFCREFTRLLYEKDMRDTTKEKYLNSVYNFLEEISIISYFFEDKIEINEKTTLFCHRFYDNSDITYNPYFTDIKNQLDNKQFK